MDAQDKSTSLTVFLHKTQIPPASKKNPDLPRSIRAGVCSSGFAESVHRSITKTAFQRLGGSMRSFSSRDLNKTDSSIGSPADTCGCGVPKGLKTSLVFSPPLIRAWWKQPCLSDSTHWNTRQRVRSKERQRQRSTFRLWPNNGLRRGGGRVPYVSWSHCHTLNLHAVAYL